MIPRPVVDAASMTSLPPNALVVDDRAIVRPADAGRVGQDRQPEPRRQGAGRVAAIGRGGHEDPVGFAGEGLGGHDHRARGETVGGRAR